MWTGLKLVVLQIQMVFGNILDGNLLSWMITLVSYILLVLLCIKKVADSSSSTNRNSRQDLTGMIALVTILVTGLAYL